jgi:hypothetical protein
MFTKNLRFFGQILHPQWANSKNRPKKGLRPLGVNAKGIQEDTHKNVNEKSIF